MNNRVFVVCETKTLGRAYELLQKISADDVELTEVIPMSEGAALLLLGSDQILQAFTESSDSTVRNLQIIKNFSDTLLEAYLGIKNPPVSGSLMIFESSVMGDVFEAARRLDQAGAEVFDLRILRGGAPKAYLFATGQAGEGFAVEGLVGTFTQIESPQDLVKSYFEIAPQK